MTTGEPDAVTDLASALRRSPRIREEEGRQAADALLLEGGRPTVDRVRSRLGRGSPNTIALFLDRWWAQLGARLRDLPGQELPSVPEPVSKALMGLWSEAIDQARALLKDSMSEQQRVLEAQRATLSDEAVNLERQRSEFTRERAAIEETVTVVRQQLNQANERHKVDTDRLQALQSECTQLSDRQLALQGELAESHARLQHAHGEAEVRVRALQERADTAERHWVRQVDEARQAALAERTRTQALERERAAETGRLRIQLESAQNECAQLREQLGRALEQRAALVTENAQLKENLRREEQQAQTALASLQRAQVEALERVEQLHTELRENLGRLRPQKSRPRT